MILEAKLVQPTDTIVWLRRDLRLQDHAALYHALKENKSVIPLFIFDTHILEKLQNKDDLRVAFIHNTLHTIKGELEKMGSSLLVFHGKPETIFDSIHPHSVYVNDDYEPYARNRDKFVSEILEKKKIPFKSFKDQVIFEKTEIVKDDRKPYSVFTPYSNKWKASLNSFYTKAYPVEKYLHNLKKTNPFPFPDLKQLGFNSVSFVFPERIIRGSLIEKYDRYRDFPALQGTSRLSIHLRFGTISIRKLIKIAIQKNKTWLNELIWREFYHMILWHYPQVATKAFKSAYDKIQWRNDEAEFKKWCAGTTGYPLVDAGMRELNTTGFMHNRVRMVTASFLTKHLLIDWRWGEAYFAEKLLDFDLAANNGGWQWAAGSGCDAAPYFRVFNPQRQQEKFDPEMKYIKKWVPEWGTPAYPKPVVDHNFARARVLSVYREALKE